PFTSAARIWTLANLGRYVPGKVWSVAGLLVLAQQAGVPPGPATASAFVIQAVALGSGVAVVAAVTPQAAPPLRLLLAGIAALGTIALLGWRPTARWLGRFVQATAPLEPLSLSAVLASTVLTVLSWGTYGASLWMLCRGLLPGARLPPPLRSSPSILVCGPRQRSASGPSSCRCRCCAACGSRAPGATSTSRVFRSMRGAPSGTSDSGICRSGTPQCSAASRSSPRGTGTCFTQPGCCATSCQ